MGRLDELDLSMKLSRQEEAARLEAASNRLLELRLTLGGLLGDGRLGPPVCVLFEGWDASGKGGAIRRLVHPMDPATSGWPPSPPRPTTRSATTSCPVLVEPARLGRHGRARPVLVRRVLVERVEGFATVDQWTRGYDEIVEFERSLVLEGMILLKFWMHISDEEQLRRFKRRETEPLKTWKLTDEDWRNREKRPAYEQAIEDMLERTDHPLAPWLLVEAESKRYARVKVVETAIAEIERGMRERGFEPPSPGRGPRARPAPRARPSGAPGGRGDAEPAAPESGSPVPAACLTGRAAALAAVARRTPRTLLLVSSSFPATSPRTPRSTEDPA